MRHQVEKSRLGRSSAHRDAMLRNMVTSLLEHERIETTVAKAKALRRVADRMITLGKRGDLHAMRLAMRVIRKKSVATKLFSELAILYADRQGGYTRILRLRNRPGDNADVAIIELTERTKASKAEETAPAKEKAPKKSVVAAARDALSASKKAPTGKRPSKAAPKAGGESGAKKQARKTAPKRADSGK